MKDEELPIADCRLPILRKQSLKFKIAGRAVPGFSFGNRQSAIGNSSSFIPHPSSLILSYDASVLHQNYPVAKTGCQLVIMSNHQDC